ncbi:MAG: Rpn family recombination-promoting nuclease/putative transposase, partial [Caldilineales bacterium]|nr:Rpn family recombination-promoting nuclease/putative transposase [Caldilineales bacterium]
MELPANPHDRFFKQLMADARVAQDFMRHYLPSDVAAALDLSTLALTGESFVDEAFQAHHTDLLFTVQLAEGDDGLVYVLIEHKSFPDRLVAFQLLRYLVKIWERALRQEGRLPALVPLVLYHGEVAWRVRPGFRWLVGGPEVVRRYVPEFEYALCDLSQFSDDEIRGEVTLRAALLVLKHILREDLGPSLARALFLLRDLAHQRTGLEYIETLLRYVTVGSRYLSAEELERTVSEAFPEGEQIMATIAEKWVEQGLQQGLQQGLSQGKEQGLAEGKREGYLAAIELGLELRFGAEGLRLLPEIAKIEDVATLRAIAEAIKTQA